MNVVLHDSFDAFLEHAGDWLTLREAEHNLLLGISADLLARAGGPPRNAHLVTVESDGQIQFASLMTPPRPPLLSLGPLEAVHALVENLDQTWGALPGAIGPKHVVTTFAQQWCARTGVDAKIFMNQCGYQLTNVTQPPPAPGEMRAARIENAGLLTGWYQDFARTTDEEVEVETAMIAIHNLIQTRQLYVWDKEYPVSMVAYGGPTPNGIRIKMVYTPPASRAHGYASQLVAGMCRELLSGERTKVFIFTDLANPVSNSIYQKIGFRRVLDNDYYKFTQ
jgi:uncharacterized protein